METTPIAPTPAVPAPRFDRSALAVGSSAHVAATGWFYTVPPVRGQVRRHRGRYPLALIAGASAAAALLPPAVQNGLLLAAGLAGVTGLAARPGCCSFRSGPASRRRGP
jgi:hypothetical protein